MSTHLTHESRTTGETAVDGLIAGIAGGLAMAAVLVLWGPTAGVTPAGALSWFDATRQDAPLTGALIHLAVAGIYGMLYRLLGRLAGRYLRPLGFWSGPVYGLILWLLAAYVLLPLDSGRHPFFPQAIFLVAHLAYGAVLGFWSSRLGDEAAGRH
jgi:uncharacterized membrane protein YagU involved in acid resistance